jgi:hypothetical protein
MKFFPFLFVALAVLGSVAGAIDYRNDVLPIMKERCWDCHSNEHKVKGNLALDDLDEVRDYQVGEFNIIRPGNPEESNFVERLLLDSSHTDFMPRKAEPIPKKEIETIEEWIRKGAVIDAKKPTEEEAKWVGGAGGSPELEKTAPQFLTWRNSEGKEIEARFLSLENGSVRLILKNGKQYSVPLSKLSAASAEQARKLSEE